MSPCHPIDLSFRVSILMSHPLYRVKLYLRRKCKAKVIGGSIIMFSIGVFIFSLPHLLSDEYLPMDEQESCNTECSAKLSSGKHYPTLSGYLWRTSPVPPPSSAWQRLSAGQNLFLYPIYQTHPKSIPLFQWNTCSIWHISLWEWEIFQWWLWRFPTYVKITFTVTSKQTIIMLCTTLELLLVPLSACS